jgi:hypothetical protein
MELPRFDNKLCHDIEALRIQHGSSKPKSVLSQSRFAGICRFWRKVGELKPAKYQRRTIWMITSFGRFPAFLVSVAQLLQSSRQGGGSTALPYAEKP